MKVKLLPLAVSAAIAMPGLALADGPVVYGKLNASLENVDVDTGADGAAGSADRWEVISNASRFGVKGDGKINDALKATYVIEWGVSGDGDGDVLSNRNRSVGLAGSFGALDVGNFDTPTKVSQGKVDQFNDQAGDLAAVLVGDTRAADIIQYTTPSMGGLQAKLAVMPGEEYDVGVEGVDRDGIADAFSTSIAYSNSMIYAAIAHDSEVKSTLNFGIKDDFSLDKVSPLFDTTRLVGQLTSGPFQGGLIYQMAEESEDGDLEQDGFLLSGAFTMGQTVLKAQYTAATNEEEGESDIDATMIGLGVDQKLSAQTTVYGYYNMLAYEDDAAGADEETKDNLGVGIVHAF